jgi:transposase
MRKLGPRKFCEEFHHEAVRLASDLKRSVKELSVELGVSVTTLRNWLHTVSLEKPASTGRVLSLKEQVRRLSKENERLHEEREILKKATAFFTRERGDEVRLHPDAHLHLARCAGC